MSDDKIFTLDDFDKMMIEIENAPRWKKTWWKIRRTPAATKERCIQLRDMTRRSRKGWAPNDVWNFDGYLTRVLGEGLVFLAENSISYPGCDGYEDPETWKTDLRQHGEALLRYSQARYDMEEDEVEFALMLLRAQKALRWIADNLPKLWD